MAPFSIAAHGCRSTNSCIELQVVLMISRAPKIDAVISIKWAPRVCSYRYTRFTDKDKARKPFHPDYDGPVQEADTCYSVRKCHGIGDGNGLSGPLGYPIWDRKRNPS